MKTISYEVLFEKRCRYIKRFVLLPVWNLILENFHHVEIHLFGNPQMFGGS